MSGKTPDSAAAAEGSIPRYRGLAEVLLRAIEQGLTGDNQALPPERELAEQHGVSRDTVRKAVRFLEERGVLYSDQGRGTFVAPSMLRRMTRFLDGFTQDAEGRGANAGQVVLLIETVDSSMALAGLLGVAPGHPLLRIKRVRTINGAKVGVHDAYFPQNGSLQISEADLQRRGSLYALLASRGIVPTEAVENLSAGAADAEDAALLQVERGSPLLICERVTLSQRRQPMEYCLMKYVPSYRYSTRISKHSISS